MEEAISLLAELIRANTVNPPGNEKAAAEILASALRKNDISSDLRPLEPGRANLTARLKGSGGGKTLVFSGHMDTVPAGDALWSCDPFGGEVSGGRIWGRGAADMKSGLAAMTMALVELSREGAALRGDLILAATAGEETDSAGAFAMVRDGSLKDAGAMVIGEPTGGRVVCAHKGALWLEVTCRGLSAHGSMPEQGVSAIDHMVRFINELNRGFRFRYEKDALLGGPTFSLGTISGGSAVNMVPDLCTLQVDMRTVPGQDHREILSDLKDIFRRLEQDSPARFGLRVINDRDPVGTSPEGPFVKLALDTSAEVFGGFRPPKGGTYFTDASAFLQGFETGFPVVICGPGEETEAHKPDESVAISQYLDSIRFYREMALRYLG